MTGTRHLRARQLHTLERVREMALDSAQSDHGKQQAISDAKRRACEQIEAEMADVQQLVREVQQQATLNVDTLQRLRAFNAVKTAQLETATAEQRQAQRLEDDARAVVIQEFERVAVVRKLRARRQTQWSKGDVQQHQKLMDEYALVRRSHERDRGS